MKMKKYFKLLRVNHYIKNLLIFLPLFFGRAFLNRTSFAAVVFGFISFSLLASTVYIINDIKDIEKDKKHPIKKNRPIASGEISHQKAKIIAILLLCISFALILCLKSYTGFVYLIVYFLLNILYTYGLKDKPIIDIVILSTGFLIRVLFGGAIINIEISNWLYLTIFAVSFYLGLGKRRNEFIKYKNNETRNVLNDYTQEFLDKNMYVCMALAIAFYALWAKDYENTRMIWTVPIVMVMAMKYNLNIEQTNNEGDPIDVILKDKVIILLGLIYFIFVMLIVY